MVTSAIVTDPPKSRSLGRMSRALVVPVPVAQNAVCEVLARLFDARDRLVLAVYDRPNCPMLRAALEEIREAIARGRDANREIDAVAVAA